MNRTNSFDEKSGAESDALVARANGKPFRQSTDGPPPRSFVEVSIDKVLASGPIQRRSDFLAVEEPLEIRLGYNDDDVREQRTISITMRTPGHDAELAAGFLLSEGIVRSVSEIERVLPWGPPSGELKLQNVVRVELRPDAIVDLKRLQRHFYTTSSCGVCGKTSIEAIEMAGPVSLPVDRPRISAEAIHRLPERLRQAQAVFDRTGGLHAAALFDSAGSIVAVREDVGRHNAVDKLIGGQFLSSRSGDLATTPWNLNDLGMLVSGRASFELVQKALMAGIPILAAVGAPSSLAVQLAQRFELTLLGFVREERFNIYSAGERITGPV